MRHVLHRHAFLLFGIVTLCLFFPLAALDQAGVGYVHTAAVALRVLIVPIYLVWLLLTILNVAVSRMLPMPFVTLVSIITMFAGLAPYAFLDYWLDRRRRSRTHTQ
ncbi:MAG TPA: hypothetical protein VMJ75_09545 [Candidatus Acidoferrales bacterium]|nr:hypothetical protein [Candidatus Acidoferrales bacterium]